MTVETILDAPSTAVSRFEDHSCVDGPHTISITPAVDSEGYLAAVGPVTTGSVDIYRFPDCEEWQRLTRCPTYHRHGLRWPSILPYEGSYYVAVRGWRDRTVSSRLLDGSRGGRSDITGRT